MARGRRRWSDGNAGPSSQRRRTAPSSGSESSEAIVVVPPPHVDELPETIETNPTPHVEAFVAYCKGHLTKDSDDGNAKAKLLRLLCRKPAQDDDNINTFYRGILDGCELPPLKHVSREGVDEGSNMARIANAIRHHFQKGALEEQTLEQIREIPGWSSNDAVWKPEFWNCRCETCVSFSVHDLKVYRFRYLEVLERRFPWYFPDTAVDDQARSEHGIRNYSYEILKESELRNFAREHWKTFFGPLQELMSTIAMDVTSSRELTMKELHALANLNKGNVTELFKSDGVVPTQRTYATIALLNDYRRNFRHGREIPGDVDDDLRELDGPLFRKEYVNNCEGTIDDHYCLGDRKFGQKRYMGVTDNPQQRHAQHASGQGSYFIAVLTGSKKCFCQRSGGKPAADSCGGWKLTSNPQSIRQGEETARYVFPGRCTELEENVETVKIIKEFGMLNTRGGDYVIPEAGSECQSNISTAMKVFASVGTKCTLCFEPGHHRSKCPRVVRGAHDDENLHNMWNLRCSDSDERGNHYEVSKAITHALVNNFPVGRIVTLSELSEQNEINRIEDVEPTMRRVIESLYGPNFALRPLQQAALRHISHEGRPDLTLTLPTAYGKTLVYLSAAVYEIMLARREKKSGKAVVFLPYSALMSDVAENLAKLTETATSQNEVARFMYGSVVFNADARARGMSMPYAGVFHVIDENRVNQRIRWTIWRGKTSDSNMSALEREDIFQNADIVFTTPDKWAWSATNRRRGDELRCDSFVKMFGDKFISALRLCVIDEAHEFRDLLGGNMRELLKRTQDLKDTLDQSADPVPIRTVLVSATMPDPNCFTKQLTGRDNDDGLHIVRPRIGNAQECVFPSDLVRDPEKEDVDEAFDRVENLQGARHKILCIFKEELENDFMCNELLRPRNFCGTRRVLIFVDSKTVATSIIRLMNTREFKNAWNLENLAPIVTPYHGDVAPHHRKLCEKLMAQFVNGPREGERQQIHFIIATSALEAGVNIKGLDVVIIPSMSRCTMRSMKQRLGRGGREADFPTVCIVGSSEASQGVYTDTELGDEDAGYASDRDETGSDLDSEDLDGASMNADSAPYNFVREPLRLLTSDLTSFGICSTRAMKIHGAMQFIGNLDFLNRELSESSRARLNELLVGIPLVDGQPRHISDAYSMLQRLLRDEMPATERSGKVMTMRGIFDRTISVLEAEPDIVPIRHNTRGIRIGRAHINKDLARISSALMMKQLHWNAQFFTPHGSLVRVVDYKTRSETGRDGDMSRWMENISAVYVKRLKRRDGAYPYTTQGESHEDVWLEQGDVSGNVDALIRRGSLRVRSTWLGFYYCRPHTNTRIETVKQEPHRWREWHVNLDVAPLNFQPDEQDKRIQGWEFFHPAESSKNGWQWDINTEFPFAGPEHDNSRSNILRLLCAELRLRVSESIKCSPRLFAINVSSQALHEKIKSAESDIRSRNLSREHLKLQDAESWRACALAKFILYEEGMVGIAMDGLRALFPVENNDVSLFSERERNTLLLDDDAKLHELWDFAIKDEWKNYSAQLRNSVVVSLNWLNEASNAVQRDTRADWE